MTQDEFNTLFDSINELPLGIQEETMDMEASKYAAYAVPVTGHTGAVPVEEKRDIELTNAAAIAFLYFDLTLKGTPIPVTTINLGCRTIKRHLLPGVEATQFIKLDTKPVNPKCDIEDWQMLLNEELIEAERAILANGRRVLTIIGDMIFHVDPKIFDIDETTCGHRKRLLAPAYNIAPDYEPGMPAMFTTDIEFYDNSAECKDWKVKTDTDGWALVRMSDFCKVHPIPGSMRNSIQHFTLRSADMENGSITIGPELAKVGATIYPDSIFNEKYKSLTGSDWSEDKPWIVIPSVTMKNFKGAGIRPKAMLIHRSSYENGVQVMRASKTGHLTSSYRPTTAKRIKKEIKLGVRKEMRTMSDPILYKDSMMDIEANSLIDRTDMSAREAFALDKSFTESRQYIAAGGSPSDCLGDNTKVFNAKCRKGFRSAKYMGVNVKISGTTDAFPEGIEAIVPHYYKFVVREHNHKRGYLEKYTEYYKDGDDTIGCINLKALTEDKGYLCIMRPPIVNGYPTFRPDQIMFSYEYNVCMMRAVHGKLMTRDNDGDFLFITTDYPTIITDYDALYHKEMRGDDCMMRKIDMIVKKLANKLPADVLPHYNGQPDALAETKKLADKLAEKYGKLNSIDYIVEHAGSKDVGAYTNAVLDLILTWRAYLKKGKEEDFRIWGNMMLNIFSEGTIQRIKHPEIVTPCTVEAVRMLGGYMLRELEIVHEYLTDEELDSIAPMYPLRPDRTTRYGVRPRDMIKDQSTWDRDISQQRMNIFMMFKEMGNMRRQKIPFETRPMTNREHIILIEATMNGLVDGDYSADEFSCDPLYMDGVKEIDMNVTDWVFDRDDDFKTAVKDLMWMIIRKYHRTSRMTAENPSIFLGAGIDDTGRIWFDSKNPIGKLMQQLFSAKRKEREVVPEIRTHGEVYAVVGLASALYLRYHTNIDISVANCGFSRRELEMYMRLNRAMQESKERDEMRLTLEEISNVTGVKLMFVPEEFLYLQTNRSMLWIHKNMIGANNIISTLSNNNAAEFRHKLFRNRKNSIIMGNDNAGIITTTADLESLRDINRDVYIIISDDIRTAMAETLFDFDEIKRILPPNARIVNV